MNDKVLIKSLMDFGLSEKEARVYVALFGLEVAAVSEIAKTARINRSSTYVVLNTLKEKGLVSISEDKKIQRFIAMPPEIVLRQAEENAARAQEIKERINEIVPELKALHKGTKHKPIIKVFEGKEGVLSALADALHCKEKLMRVCSSHEEWLKSDYDFREYFVDYIKQRHVSGVKMRGIHPGTEMLKQLTAAIPKGFDHIALIPKGKYKFPAEIAIYDNKIGYISPDKKGLAIIIESQEIAEVMKSLFDLAYKEAVRLKIN